MAAGSVPVDAANTIESALPIAVAPTSDNCSAHCAPCLPSGRRRAMDSVQLSPCRRNATSAGYFLEDFDLVRAFPVPRCLRFGGFDVTNSQAVSSSLRNAGRRIRASRTSTIGYDS